MCGIDLTNSSQRRLQSIRVSTVILWIQVTTVPSFKTAANAVRVKQILSTTLNAASKVSIKVSPVVLVTPATTGGLALEC